MVRAKAIEDFTLGDFNKLQNIVRANVNTEGKIYKGDVFECDDDMAKYLTGGNALNKTVIEILEFKPFKEEIKEAVFEEVKEEPKKETKKEKKGKKRYGK